VQLPWADANHCPSVLSIQLATHGARPYFQFVETIQACLSVLEAVMAVLEPLSSKFNMETRVAFTARCACLMSLPGRMAMKIVQSANIRKASKTYSIASWLMMKPSSSSANSTTLAKFRTRIQPLQV
jgi:hypothetical protein